MPAGIDKAYSSGNPLQLFVWHGEGRFLFIAASGGSSDLVKEQPIASQTLSTIRTEYQRLSEVANRHRSWGHSGSSTLNGTSAPPTDEMFRTINDLGSLVRKIVLHPDIRTLLNGPFSEIIISTNEFSIPWEILGVGDSFLSLKCPVTRRLQSARPMSQPVRVVFKNKVKVLVIHNPTEDLPETDNEAAEIEALLEQYPMRFEVYRLRGKECPRLKTLDLISKCDIFHYAGHAYFDPLRPKESGLLLCDGPLLATEIQNYLDETAPTLVFLNACDSGTFGAADMVTAGQDMASLAHPFISAGCGAVIASSLPVGDSEGARFASKLYEYFTSGEFLSKSMWFARKYVVEQYGLTDPTWGAFLLFGNGALRVIVNDADKDLGVDDLLGSIRQAISWLNNERLEAGHWCDRVYRSEAPMNTAEVLLAFKAAGLSLDPKDLNQSILCILRSVEEGFSAAPYEPAGLGIYTSCVCYVLRALCALPGDPSEDLIASIHAARIKSIQTLLDLQQIDGGWSWGEPKNNVGSYSLFTTEAIGSLEEASAFSESLKPRVHGAIMKGIAWLKNSQLTDGGWSYKDGLTIADPASTCYALCQLLSDGSSVDEPTISRGLKYLSENLDLANLSDSQFFVDNRIEVPWRARSEWPHFEDYGGLGGLCQLLLSAPAAETYLGTSGLLSALLKHIVSNQEEERGWPNTYSTIYVTAFYVEVLAAAVSFLQSSNDGAS